MSAQPASSVPAPSGAPSRTRGVRAVLAALLVSLLALGALPVPSAFAATAGFGHSVSNGGGSTFSAITETTATLAHSVITYEFGTTMPARTLAEWVALFGASGVSAPGTTITSVTADVSDLDFTGPGDYRVIFTVTDSDANTATITGTFRVVDTTAPTLTLGSEASTFRKGGTQVSAAADWIALFEATATDSGTGMPSTGALGITVNATAVNYAVSGTYPVLITATDNAGNTTTKTADYTVAYAGDPAVTLTNATVLHEVGDAAPASTTAEWVALFGANGTSAAGTTIASLVADATAVDFTAVGDHQVVFTVTDSYGNQAAAAATLRVDDTIAPTATIAQATGKHGAVTPATPWTGNDWVAFFDAAATDGSGTGIDPGSWTADHAVNWLVAGDYEVILSVRDLAGNVSNQVTGTITIQTPPTGTDATKRIAQDASVELDPLAQVDTTGTLRDLTATDIADPAHGAVSLDGNRVTYTPDPGYAGMDTVVVTVTDDLGQELDVEMTITVVAPTFEIDVDRGYAGEASVRASASGLIPGAEYSVELHSQPKLLGTVEADADGNAVLIARIPADAAPGAHHVILLNQRGDERGSADFTVLARAKALAATGADVAPLLWVGLGAVLLGLPLLLLVRRRRHQHSTERS